MKKTRDKRWKPTRPNMPLMAQIMELVVAILVITAGQSLWSVVVGADPDITPPSVPTGLNSTGQSPTSIDLSWAASTDDTAVTGYHVYRNGVQVGSPTTTTYSDTGLTPNTSYSYTVSAYDAASNESAHSSALPQSTLADTLAPSTPSNLHQTGSTISSVSIAWNASSDNVGVVRYEIYRNGSLIRSQAGTSFTDTGLSVYTHYIYNVTAHDAANNASLLSAALGADTAPDITAPSVPDNIHKISSTVSSVTIGWDSSTDDVGVAGYRVYRNGVLVGSPGGTSFTDTGLTVNSGYTYTVTARDAAINISAESAPFATNSSADTTAPTIPTSLHSTSVMDTSIDIAWTASSDDVAVTGYKIYRGANLIGTSATTSFHDSGLSPATDYSYTVRAYDAASNTSVDSSALDTQTAFDTTDPSVPSNLRAATRTDTTIALAWDAASDNVGVTGYDIYRGGTLITSTTGTTFTDTSLSVNSNYTYRVRAHDNSGNNSAQSSPLNTSTLSDTIDPSSPNNLVSPAQTTTTADISWDAATDDVAVASYNVYRNGSLVTNTATTSHTDTGLHYNTHYTYTVTALDASGNESAPTAGLDVATLPDTVAPTVSLTAPSDGQSAQLTFAISALANDNLDLSRVEFYADSVLIKSLTAAPFAFNWNSYAVHNGSRTITAKAIDASGNFSSTSIHINITNPPPALLGDINGDHKVNIFDLGIMLSHWKKPGAGDLNNSGKVDIFDLSILLARYGQNNSNYN